MTVTLYMSSVSASLMTKKNTTRLESILQANGIVFETVDCAIDEEGKEMTKGKVLPIVRAKEKLYTFQDIDNANEEGAIKDLMGP